MKKVIGFTLCFLMIFEALNGFEFLPVNSVNSNQEVRFESLISSLDDSDDNSISLWIKDVDCDMIKQAALNQVDLKEEDITDDIGIERIQEYIRIKRSLFKSAYEQNNSSFYNETIKEVDCTVLFQSNYSPLFIVKGTKEQISTILESEEVISAQKYVNVEYSCCSDLSMSNSGTKYIRDTLGIYGDGDGVVIGLLETGFPDVEKTYGTYNYFDETKVSYANSGVGLSEHATFVAALMVGQTVVCDGKTYRGAAPEADLVCARTSSSDDLGIRTAIEALISANANIINASIGHQTELSIYDADGNESYFNMRNWIDHLAFNHDVHFVVAAGNMEDADGVCSTSGIDSDGNGYIDDTEYVNVLGMSYNAITVANVADNDGSATGYAPSTLNDQYSTPYTISPKSSYKTWTDGFCKPDIACFGANIQYGELSASGTSLSSPQVAGMIAQLCSVYPRLLTNNSGVKALLAATAVYRTNDTLTEDSIDDRSELLNKQGAGIANVRCAYACYSAGKTIDLTLSGQTATYSFNINVPSSYSYLRLAMSWIRKVSLSGYSSNEHISATPTVSELANLDVYVYCDGELVASSENLVTNMELLQFEVERGGTYTVKIVNKTYSENNINCGNQYVSLAWY